MGGIWSKEKKHLYTKNLLHKVKKAFRFPMEYSFEEHIERLDAPAKIPLQGRLAYLRKEI